MRDLVDALRKKLFVTLKKEQVWTKPALLSRRQCLAASTSLRVTGIACWGDWRHRRLSQFSQPRHECTETPACWENAPGQQKQPLTQHVVSSGLRQSESWAWGKAHVFLRHLSLSSGQSWCQCPLGASACCLRMGLHCSESSVPCRLALRTQACASFLRSS